MSKTTAMNSSEKTTPLAPNPTTRSKKSLNDTLNTDYIDVSPEDTSLYARTVRSVAKFVGSCCTPRQMLIVLRILKALTFSFLVFTFVADLMYTFFVGFFASSEVNAKMGGSRDTIIRIYGLLLSCLAFFVELDMGGFVKFFPGLKGFIPRALLLFFIATITSAHPLHMSQRGRNRNGDDDASLANYDEQVTSEIPDSTVVFQMVSSIVLAGCAVVYLFLGMLCFDRFTSKAFLSNKDPLASTAIPSSSIGTLNTHPPVQSLTQPAAEETGPQIA